MQVAYFTVCFYNRVQQMVLGPLQLNMFLSRFEPSKVLAPLISVFGLVTELQRPTGAAHGTHNQQLHKVKQFIQPTRAQMGLLLFSN